jgi:hypothetical protein
MSMTPEFGALTGLISLYNNVGYNIFSIKILLLFVTCRKSFVDAISSAYIHIGADLWPYVYAIIIFIGLVRLPTSPSLSFEVFMLAQDAAIRQLYCCLPISGPSK